MPKVGEQTKVANGKARQSMYHRLVRLMEERDELIPTHWFVYECDIDLGSVFQKVLELNENERVYFRLVRVEGDRFVGGQAWISTTLSTSEVRTLLGTIEDGHVMERTLEEAT